MVVTSLVRVCNALSLLPGAAWRVILRCSGRRPDGPGADPRRNFLTAFSTSAWPKVIWGVYVVGVMMGRPVAGGCFSFMTFRFALEGVAMPAAMSTTRKLNLVNTGLTAVQVEKLLSLIAANCPMESLDPSANVLSMVEPELMAQAVNKLDVTLIDTSLTVNQVLKIDHIFD